MSRKLLKIFTIAFLLLLPFEAFSMDDGNDLLDSCNQFLKTGTLSNDNSFEAGNCLGFLNGISDILTWEAVVGANIKDANDPQYYKKIYQHALYCMPANVKNIQMIKIVVRFLNDHPEKLNQSPSLLVLEALKQAFPCNQN